MVDPISIISLLGTAATLTKNILGYASSVKDAPKELENLRSELANLHGIVEPLVVLAENEDGGGKFSESSILYKSAGDLVITLESLQAKLDHMGIAKGMRKVYNRLKWPVDGLETQKTLQVIERNTQIFHFALTAEGNKILSQTFEKASEMLSASQHISQVQSNIYRAVVELPKYADIAAEIEKLRLCLSDNQSQRWADDQDFLGQISTLDFTAMQKEAYSKRHGGTGQWVLETPEFQTWLKSENGQHSVLWCPGNPGVGKTVVTSIAVNHLIEHTYEQNIAIIYVYCDYGNPLTFSVDNLLGSLIRQLVAQTSHAETVAELRWFLKRATTRRNMTEEESSSWTETLSRTFDVVYTFVDALDECPEIGRDSLLLRLHKFSLGNMRIFLTSRLNVDVRNSIPDAIRAGISAANYDIIDYVEAKIQKSRRLARFTAESPELKRHIIKMIVAKADGMFLLAGLQTESLSNQTCVREVRSALDRLPTDIFTMYDQTFERIGDQSKEDANLGLKVLSLIFGATRPLEIDELRHALAIQPGDSNLDLEALVDVETLLSATAGLVITHQDDDDGPEFFRLAHYTLQEYLKTSQERLFPNLEHNMARICLSYLCLDEFGSGKCATDQLVEKRRNAFPFLDYAAKHWAAHLRGVQMELMDQTLAFVEDSAKTTAWLQSFKYNEVCDQGLSTSAEFPLDPVFLAAHFHLTELFTRLISTRDIDSRNDRGETPLLRAVDVEPWQKGGKKPYLDFRDAGTWQKDGGPPLTASLDTEQHAMVRLILDLDADIDAKDELGMTAAFRAVTKENSGILALLLDRGADIDARLDDGESLMHVAVTKWDRVDIMQLLLDRGADIHVLTENGKGLVHTAAISPTSTMLDFLIDSGASFHTGDEEGLTPLMIAAGRSNLGTLKALINRGARCDIKDSNQKSLLHFAVSAFKPLPNVAKLVMQTTQNVDAIDIRGRTPLHYASFRLAQMFGDERFKDWKPRVTDVTRLLIAGGASQTILDKDGRMPKDYLGWSTFIHADQWRRGYWKLTLWEKPWHTRFVESQNKAFNESTAISETDEDSEEEQQEAL